MCQDLITWIAKGGVRSAFATDGFPMLVSRLGHDDFYGRLAFTSMTATNVRCRLFLFFLVFQNETNFTKVLPHGDQPCVCVCVYVSMICTSES